MITTNSFAATSKCEEINLDEQRKIFKDGYEKGMQAGMIKGHGIGMIDGAKSCVCPTSSLDSNSREQELEMRLTQCNSRNGWKY